ncbi:Gfo/Idh/MocA family oxidoreductase [Salinicola sp. DM10]|uniref:Gfo/Idh/MocA family oxidoreductase n=1 Tax=Salinicola sp. DM10 TaxID=2815721 RepID=UPI001A8EC474|nr:Gfo/Idh/MocA family oxidoreductase [Salinicola sp. DM10]MCE3025997.1 Gfo/Idh/MocA family oxidoreductase [Salinicola sp. DM10]
MLNLGMIGLSSGNGHPYSWGAIFNGYDKSAMESCGFPVIPRYLECQIWPDSQLSSAKVTSIWTQDQELSTKVASAARIPKVVGHPNDMIGMIDGLLLARDDAENHYKHAAPFLKAGIPVYIDKPIALSLNELDALYDLEQYPGQIFSCSALSYSDELKLSDAELQGLGEIRNIIATTPKSWNKYAVHVIEPSLRFLSSEDSPETFSRMIGRYGTTGAMLSVSWKSGIQTSFLATGDAVAPISIRLHGTKGWKELLFTDAFSAFKKALEDFVRGIENNTVQSPKEHHSRVVSLIEQGKS